MTSTTSLPTRSVIGPLTTTFTRPSSCSSLFSGFSTLTGSFEAYQAQSCIDPVSIEYGYEEYTNIGAAPYGIDAHCWPSGPGNTPGGGPYSPGLFCPDGYTTACSAALSEGGSQPSFAEGSSFPFQFSLLPGETAAGCCPSGYGCFVAELVGQTCLSTVSTGEITTFQCELDTDLDVEQTGSAGTVSIPLVLTSTIQTTVVYADVFSVETTAEPWTITKSTIIPTISLFAPMIQLNWKASDRSSSSADTPPSPPPSGSFSTGAKAAIGVLVLVALLTMAALVATLLFRRRKRKQIPEYRDKPELEAINSNKLGTRGTAAVELSAEAGPQEAGGQILQEAEGAMPQELSAPTMIHELESSERRSFQVA